MPTASNQPKPGAVPRRTQRERTDRSDRLMLDATEALILEVGTLNTTLKAVGERAGYSRGLANARFGSKETLFLRLTERCLADWTTELRDAEVGKGGLEALLSRLDAMVAYAERFPDDARVLYVLWFESVGSSSPMRESLRNFHEQARKDIARLVIEAQHAGEVPATVDPEHFSLHFTSALFGLSYQWLVNPEAITIRQVVASLRDHMLLILRSAPRGPATVAP
ncbi:MAG: TetR/AcrR family transcriptional regulator [Pseudomonadota bacterium]